MDTYIALIIFVILFLLYGLEKLYIWSKGGIQYLKGHKILHLVNKRSKTFALPFTREKPEANPKGSPTDSITETLPQLPPLVRCRARSSFSNDGGISSRPVTRPQSPSSYCPSSIPEPRASHLRPSGITRKLSSSSSHSSFGSVWCSPTRPIGEAGKSDADGDPEIFSSTPPRRRRGSRAASASIHETSSPTDPAEMRQVTASRVTYHNSRP